MDTSGELHNTVDFFAILWQKCRNSAIWWKALIDNGMHSIFIAGSNQMCLSIFLYFPMKNACKWKIQNSAYRCYNHTLCSKNIFAITHLPPGPLLLTWINVLRGLTVIPEWWSNYTNYKVWGEITYPFPNFKGVTSTVLPFKFANG